MCVEFCGYVFVFFQAEDGIRDLVRSRGLGDVYKRQLRSRVTAAPNGETRSFSSPHLCTTSGSILMKTARSCLLYTSDAADERSSVDLGGRRIIKKKKNGTTQSGTRTTQSDTHSHSAYTCTEHSTSRRTTNTDILSVIG